MSVTIQLRRDTAADWTSVNPVLNEGELGVETDTRKSKMGDGVTAWTTLPYWNTGAADALGAAAAAQAAAESYAASQASAAQSNAETYAAAQASAALAAAETYASGLESTEADRAEAAEGTLTSGVSTNAAAITAETSRAEAAEAGKASSAALSSETTRAETAESTNATATTAETTRAEGAEATLTSGVSTNAAAITAETSRAETAEALLAPKVSPALTGTPTAPTATPLDDSTKLATTAYADSAVGVETSRAATAEALKAPLASPGLTGSPTAPTQTTGDSSTKIATDAFVATAVAAEISRAETAEALLAPKVSPTFSGTVTVPATVNPTDAAQKAYVDSVAQGLDAKPSAKAVATSAITLSGTQTIDGVAVAAGDRVLATGQGTGSQNGLWVVAAGAWARPADFTSGSTQLGAFVFVEGGTVGASSGWVLVATSAVTVDTTSQTWTQFSGAGEILAGTNLVKAGNTLSLASSPALGGTPTAPTPSALTNSTQVATTAYADSAVGVETSRSTSAEALKAPLASPALTGTPTAPTQTTGDSSTKLATDAFVATAVAVETSRAETAETAIASLREFPVALYAGADPTGTTDSTAAVTAARAAAYAAGGGIVSFGSGIWMFNTVTTPTPGTGASMIPPVVHFKFAGPGTTVLTPLNANAPLFVCGSTNSRGIHFIGGFTVKAHSSGSTGPAFDLNGARQWVIESPSYLDSLSGAAGTAGTYNQVFGLGVNTYACVIKDPICEGQRLGSSFIGPDNVSTVVANANSIINPLFENNTATYMIDAAGTVSLSVTDGIIEGNIVTAAIRLGQHTRVSHVWLEQNYRSDLAGGTTIGSPVVTDAAVIAGDVGKIVWGSSGVPGGATILSVNVGAGNFTMSANATANASGVELLIGGLPFAMDGPGVDSTTQGYDPGGCFLEYNEYWAAMGSLIIPAGVVPGTIITGPLNSLTVTDYTGSLITSGQPAAARLNNASGGTTTTAVTTANSGGTSGTQFDAVTGTVTFDSTQATGPSSLSYKLVAAASASNAAWNVPQAVQRVTQYLRAYVNFSGSVFSTGILATSGLWYSVGSNGTYLTVRAVPGATVTGSVTLAAGTWYRVEAQVNFATGTVTACLFNAAGVLLETIVAVGGTAGTSAITYYGSYSSATGTMWLANLGFGNDTWLGNAVSLDTPTPAGQPAPTTYLNNAAGGTSGTTVTTGNSGGSSGTAFNAVAGSPTFSNAVSYPPSSLVYNMTTSGTNESLSWAVPVSILAGQTIFMREYVYFPGGPFATTTMSTDGLWYECGVNSSSQFFVRAVPGLSVSTGITPAAGTWYRLEMTANFAAGTATLYVYDAYGNQLATATATGGTSPSTTHVYFGQLTLTTTGTMCLANLGLTNGTWLGSAVAGVASVTAGDASIVVGGTLQAPTLVTATLDQIAALHPAVASVGMNSEKLTNLLAGVAATDGANYGQVLAAEPPWMPSDSGWLAWNFDPASAYVLNTIPAGNTIYLMRINIRQPMSITNVILYLVTVASGLTSGENYAGLLSSSGTLLGVTADQTSAWETGGGTYHVMALAGGPYTVSPPFVWVPFVWNGGTGPTLAEIHADQATLNNVGTSVSTARAATNGTGTSLASITPASNSFTYQWFAAVS